MHDLHDLPKISFEPERIDDFEGKFRFWAALRPWFQQHGYYLHLHKNKEDGTRKYSYPQTVFMGEDKFPYAHVGVDEPQEDEPSFGDDEPRDDKPAFTSQGDASGRIHFAQDSEGRHVAIKLVKGDSDEYRITRFLSERPSFVPGVVSILALLPYDGHWFLVMPRSDALVCCYQLIYSLIFTLVYRTLGNPTCSLIIFILITILSSEVYIEDNSEQRAV